MMTIFVFAGSNILIVFLGEGGNRDRIALYLQLPMQLVPITINIVSSNPAHVEVYSIQHYVIKFVSDLRHIGGFLRFRFPLPIKGIIRPIVCASTLTWVIRQIDDWN
jgi:hypothetical protein